MRQSFLTRALPNWVEIAFWFLVMGLLCGFCGALDDDLAWFLIKSFLLPIFGGLLVLAAIPRLWMRGTVLTRMAVILAFLLIDVALVLSISACPPLVRIIRRLVPW